MFSGQRRIKLKNKSLIWLIKNGKTSIMFVLGLTAASIFLSLLSLKFVSVSRELINIATGTSGKNLADVCILLVVLLLIRLGVQILISYMNVHASSKLEISLKRSIFKNLISKDYLSLSAYHSGELLNRINNDVSVIVSGVITLIPSAALFLTSIVGGFIYLYTIDNILALLILAVGPLVFVGARLYSKRYKSLHKKCQDANGKTQSFMLEMLQNLLVVKSFSNENAVLDHNETLQRQSYKLRVRRTTVSVISNIAMFLVFNAGYYFSLAYGAYRLWSGAITYGDVTAILQLVNQIQAPFKNISSLVPQAFSMIASAERIIELEELKTEAETGSKSLPDGICGSGAEIVFDNVHFAYNADSKISVMNFSFKLGEFTAIAGESGIGKSTAIKLLLGILTPQSGRIYLKTRDGEYDLGSRTRALFSYVPQGNLILSGTIRENITFANPDVDEEDIIRSAKIARIWDFISSLEDGLDTYIGEKGLGLSEGQAQRISVARAILYDAPVLLLDESTSALDPDTEAQLLSSLKKMTDKTCIIVSHKKAAIDICDRVVHIVSE